MMAASSLIGELRQSLNDESKRIQREFEASGDGRAAVAQRTRLVEDILHRLWRDIVSPDPSLEGPVNFALVATGGFGRGWLFPYSDIDLLFLFGDREAEQVFKDPCAAVLAGIVGSAAEAESGFAHVGRVRPLRPRTTPSSPFPFSTAAIWRAIAICSGDCTTK